MSEEGEHIPAYNAPAEEIRGWNDGILEEFRANHGKLGGIFENMNLALLTTTGARSNRPTTTPITYFIDGTRFLVVASNFGRDHHPAWFHNVVHNPAVTLEIGTERIQGRAVVTEGAERDRLFAYVSLLVPRYRDHQTTTHRIIPVVAIERAGE
jgi:deazaflavin-dependent oxidoreductase (nitroreductase family)